MMTKIAHMRENRKNNKGFSLVELIIVIAIMVALIAVLGPQYVKYVASSRNASLATAAEDFASYVKTELAEGSTISLAANKQVKIKISAATTLSIALDTGSDDFTYVNSGDSLETLITGSGANMTKKMNATDSYTLTVTSDANGLPTVKLDKDATTGG